jgi:hypothetical protein
MKIYKIAQMEEYQMVTQRPGSPVDPNAQMQNLQKSQEALQYFDNLVTLMGQTLATITQLEENLGVATGTITNTVGNIIKEAAMSTSAFQLLTHMNFVGSIDDLFNPNQISNIEIIINNNMQSIGQSTNS